MLLSLWSAAFAVELIIDLTTDDAGEETSFDLVLDPEDDEEVVRSRLEGSFDSNAIYQFRYEVAAGDYEFRILDSGGDGICCDLGVGSYTITTPDEVIPSPTGGEFDFEETVDFRLGPPDDDDDDDDVPATAELLIDLITDFFGGETSFDVVIDPGPNEVAILSRAQGTLSSSTPSISSATTFSQATTNSGSLIRSVTASAAFSD